LEYHQLLYCGQQMMTRRNSMGWDFVLRLFHFWFVLYLDYVGSCVIWICIKFYRIVSHNHALFLNYLFLIELICLLFVNTAITTAAWTAIGTHRNTARLWWLCGSNWGGVWSVVCVLFMPLFVRILLCTMAVNWCCFVTFWWCFVNWLECPFVITTL
jgi:uncharacterized membrane protein